MWDNHPGSGGVERDHRSEVGGHQILRTVQDSREAGMIVQDKIRITTTAAEDRHGGSKSSQRPFRLENALRHQSTPYRLHVLVSDDTRVHHPPADAGFDFTGDFSGPPVITADGSTIAFCARSEKQRDSIWVQSLSELTARKVEGTDGAVFPFWSADGKSLGFFADGHLKTVPAAGGPVTILADAPNPRGGSWNQDNVIIYEPDHLDALWRISASGGSPARLTTLETSKHTTHRWPQFLPDGKHFVFFATNHAGGTEQGIYYGSLADGTYKHVLDADSDAQYASGYLLFHLQSALLAQKFDPATASLSGPAMPVANVVEYNTGTWHATFAASQNGILIYEPGLKSLGNDIVWLDRNGKPLGKVAERAAYKGSGTLSPDGKRLAVTEGDPQGDIWVLDLAGGSRTRFTSGGATHLQPSWSAD